MALAALNHHADEFGVDWTQDPGVLIGPHWGEQWVMTRAIQSAWLQTAEGAARRSADAKNRYRGAKSEAGEATAAVEAAWIQELVREQDARNVRGLLARQCAMLAGLAR